MSEYYTRLAKAVADQPNSTPETRAAIYELARKALRKRLRALKPPVSRADLEKEIQAFDKAAAQLEVEFSDTQLEAEFSVAPETVSETPAAEIVSSEAPQTKKSVSLTPSFFHSPQKPKLTIDIGPLLEDQWTGIPVFTRRLVQALLLHGGIDLDFAFRLVRFPVEQVRAALAIGTGSFLRADFEARSSIEYDLIESANPILFPSAKGNGGFASREASTVHDMSTLFMPENHEEPNIAHHLDHFEAELTTDDTVFCISQATRAALVSALPSIASKTRLLYQYADWPDNFDILDRNLPPLRLGRYAVVIGTIEPRKNLTLLINALSLPEVSRQDLAFIVIGKKGWLVDSFLENLTPDERRRLIFSGFVSEFVKYRLIKGAEFLVFPSLYEGFGIPALEAMSLGKPVLASRTSSFPEVVGDAGVYYDPLSTSEFAAALEEIADERKIAELAPKAVAQNATFGWQRMAQPVVDWVTG